MLIHSHPLHTRQPHAHRPPLATEVLLPALTETAVWLAHVPAQAGRARLLHSLVHEPGRSVLRAMDAVHNAELWNLSTPAQLLRMALLVDGAVALGEGLTAYADSASSAATGAVDAHGARAATAVQSAASVLHTLAVETQAVAASLVSGLASALYSPALQLLDNYAFLVAAEWNGIPRHAPAEHEGEAPSDNQVTRTRAVSKAVRHLTATHTRLQRAVGPASRTLTFATGAHQLLHFFAKVRVWRWVRCASGTLA